MGRDSDSSLIAIPVGRGRSIEVLPHDFKLLRTTREIDTIRITNPSRFHRPAFTWHVNNEPPEEDVMELEQTLTIDVQDGWSTFSLRNNGPGILILSW